MRKHFYPFRQTASALLLAAFMLFFTVNDARSATITFTPKSAVAGSVQNGKQSISFTGTFTNVSRHEYVGRVNYVEVSVHGWFRGREEKYKRQVKVDWTFSPALGPGQSKGLKINFSRVVDPSRNMFRYDDVKIRILSINFNRVS